jgi:thiosulfate/3-mercaptopyruvate sulfurtransferase
MSEISLDELEARRDELVVLDVRTSAEYAGTRGYPCDPRQGHIPGARHLPLEELEGLTADAVRELIAEPEGAEIVCYCHSGGRSFRATETLRAAGYAARNYRGSWHEWSRLAPG